MKLKNNTIPELCTRLADICDELPMRQERNHSLNFVLTLCEEHFRDLNCLENITDVNMTYLLTASFFLRNLGIVPESISSMMSERTRAKGVFCCILIWTSALNCLRTRMD